MLCLLLSGCFVFGWGGDDTGDDMPEPVPAVVIAVGATVNPKLEQGLCDYPRFGYLCVDAYPDDITNVTVDSDAFTVGQPVGDVFDKTIQITAHRAGDATLTFTTSNIIRTETVTVLIRAAEIDSTSLSLGCGNQPGEQVGITPSVKIRFEAIAMAGEQQLLTGNMEIVTAPGFTLTPPQDNQRFADAPAELGTYEWQLAGGTTQSFLIYDYAELQPVLAKSFDQYYVDGRVGNNVKVCVHGRKERAMVEVASGTCRPSFGYGEVVGPMPLSLGSAVTFGLVSDVAESCTLTATMESTGHTTSATFDATVEPPLVASGTPIGAAPMTFQPRGTQGDDCSGSLTDGDCDGHLEYPPIPTDADCYIDSDWEYTHLDGPSGSTPVGANDYVGVGLTTEMRFKVVAKIVGLIPFDVGPPQNFVIDHSPDELEFTSLGCQGSEEVVALKALTSASIIGHAISLSASNLDDVEDTRVRTKAIDRIEWGGRPGFTAVYWQGTEAGSTPTYFSGSTQLRGRAAYSIESPTNAVLVAGGGFSGNVGDDVTLRSVAAPSLTQHVVFVDATSVSSITDFAFNEIGNLDQELCTMPKPSTGSATIYGKGPKPKISITGPAFTMGSDFNGRMCLFGYQEGASDITLTWGTHSETRNWRVRDPFGI